jgi:hypothetical protein
MGFVISVWLLYCDIIKTGKVDILGDETVAIN